MVASFELFNVSMNLSHDKFISGKSDHTRSFTCNLNLFLICLSKKPFDSTIKKEPKVTTLLLTEFYSVSLSKHMLINTSSVNFQKLAFSRKGRSFFLFSSKTSY